MSSIETGMADGIWNVTNGVTTISPSLINITATDHNCTDHKEQHIPNGLLYTPRGSDACRVCTCASGSPILCRTVLCAPPSHCNSIKVITANTKRTKTYYNLRYILVIFVE